MCKKIFNNAEEIHSRSIKGTKKDGSSCTI